MMYEELIKDLRFCASSECKCIECPLEQAADAIKELNKPRWIPVWGRLPEDMCNVLVTDGENVGMGWLDGYTWRHGALERDWYAPNTPVEENKITHWMPLPEPPKEK